MTIDRSTAYYKCDWQIQIYDHTGYTKIDELCQETFNTLESAINYAAEIEKYSNHKVYIYKPKNQGINITAYNEI